jgi:hypothetical protein
MMGVWLFTSNQMRGAHNAGVAFVDRIPVEVTTDTRELEAVLRRFLKRLAETR